MVLATASVLSAKEFYAVISRDPSASVLTFYYDDNRKDFDKTKNLVYLYNSEKDLHNWGKEYERVKKVKIDASMKSYYPTTMRGWFEGLENLEEIDRLVDVNTENVTTMERLFYGCKKLKKVYLSWFDTGKVTDMSYMFFLCENLTELDLYNFNTKFVRNMSHMFAQCENLAKLNISSFDTRNVTDMSYMFGGCFKLESIDLPKSFVTRNVENMEAMFYGGDYKKLDLTGFNPLSLKEASYMFSQCDKLETIYVNEMYEWKPASAQKMFANCKKLVGGYGFKYSDDYMGPEYACVDTEEHRGYFTRMYPTRIVMNAFGVRLSRIGETYKLQCSLVNETKVKFGSIDWSSDNPGIVSVDSHGLVTALSEGVAKITATSADGVLKATATFRVDTGSYAQSITLDNNLLTFFEISGTPKSLSATLSPGNVTRNKITWTSSNPEVASVNPQGLVFAQGYGTAVITASVPRGFSDTNEMLSDLTATCTVTVKEAESAPRVRPWSVSFPQTDYYLSPGKTCDLGLIIVDKYATDFTVTSTMPQVVEVSADGKSITAKEIGNARLIVQWTDPDGNAKTAMARVEVR